MSTRDLPSSHHEKKSAVQKSREGCDVYQRETFVPVWSESRQAEEDYHQSRVGYGEAKHMHQPQNEVACAALVACE